MTKHDGFSDRLLREFLKTFSLDLQVYFKILLQAKLWVAILV